MAYITGSMTDANPGPALYALMAPALTTAGFTLIDTVTIATKTHKVWKSAAANNSRNLDWYLDVAYTTTGAGNLWLTPFEFFDPATDLGYRGVYGNASSTAIETTYYTRFGATGSALETNWVGANQTTISMGMTVSSFGYWISVTGDRVAAIESNNPTVALYAGMYLPDALHVAKVTAANVYPLVSAKLAVTAGLYSSAMASGGTGTMALTRLPGTTALTGSGWGGAGYTWPQMRIDSVTYGQYPSAVLPYASGASVAAAWPVIVTAGGNVGSAVGIYGTLIDCLCTPSSGVTRGDTVTVSGAPWVLTSTVTAQSCSFLIKAV